jgi:gas vesicle protein
VPRGDTDWERLAIFGVGLALGIAVGAGAALLTAPQTGAEARTALLAQAGRLKRRTSRRGRDAWDELRDEIRGMRRNLRRRRARRREERELAELEQEVGAV